MQPIQPSDLFVTVAQMRDGIDTLIKRGKPATADELQQLLALVKTQGEQLLSQAQQGYRITLNGEAAAKLIVPYMPTNAETARIMTEATAAMRATLAQGAKETAAQVQQLQAIRASIPPQVSIATPFFGFVNWQSALISLGVVGLFLALAAWQGSKKAAAEAKAEMYTRNYGVLYKENQTRKQAEDQVWKYYPKVAERYLPTQ
jgi:hypothetical protein